MCAWARLAPLNGGERLFCKPCLTAGFLGPAQLTTLASLLHVKPSANLPVIAAEGKDVKCFPG